LHEIEICLLNSLLKLNLILLKVLLNVGNNFENFKSHAYLIK